MISRPTILAPATPSELLSTIVHRLRYPTTLLIGCSKEDFVSTLAQDVYQHASTSGHHPEPTPQDITIGITQPENKKTAAAKPTHHLLHPSLMQIATSRHIRTVFIPSVTHLQAYLTVFSSTSDSNISPPTPNWTTQPAADAAATAANSSGKGGSSAGNGNTPPLLLVYGFLEVHRDGIAWSAQGISNSLAALIECGARESLTPVIVEPKGAGGHEDLEQVLAAKVPLLSGTYAKGDGSWSGRTVEMSRILGRWLEFGHGDVRI
jgi:hypothetical protein